MKSKILKRLNYLKLHPKYLSFLQLGILVQAISLRLMATLLNHTLRLTTLPILTQVLESLNLATNSLILTLVTHIPLHPTVLQVMSSHRLRCLINQILIPKEAILMECLLRTSSLNLALTHTLTLSQCPNSNKI